MQNQYSEKVVTASKALIRGSVSGCSSESENLIELIIDDPDNFQKKFAVQGEYNWFAVLEKPSLLNLTTRVQFEDNLPTNDVVRAWIMEVIEEEIKEYLTKDGVRQEVAEKLETGKIEKEMEGAQREKQTAKGKLKHLQQQSQEIMKDRKKLVKAVLIFFANLLHININIGSEDKKSEQQLKILGDEIAKQEDAIKGINTQIEKLDKRLTKAENIGTELLEKIRAVSDSFPDQKGVLVQADLPVNDVEHDQELAWALQLLQYQGLRDLQDLQVFQVFQRGRA